MKTTRKCLCLILSLVLVLTCAIPVFAHPFQDVPDGKWYTPYVEYVYQNNLMNGTTDTTFAPNANMSRAMVVTVLHRLEGSPAASASLPFTDVPSGKYYTEPVRWSYENQIVNGSSSTTFSPNADITREQLVTIFYRYAQAKGLDTSDRAFLTRYSDSDKIGNFAYDSFRWAVLHGIINGTSDTLLSPKGSATRAQCATILQRFISWMNGDPPMPSGAVPVSGAQSFDNCNTYAPKNAVQDINYWSNYQVCYKNEPNPKDNVVIYRLKNVTTDQVKAYVQMLQNNGFTLKGSYSRKNLYSWGLVSNAVPNATAHNLMYEEGIACHVSLWHSDSGWFFYVSPDLEVCDLGLRIDGTTADRRPWGESADSGLLQLYPGRYQTSDGRLAATVGCATVLQDGKSTTNYLQASLNDDGILQLRVLSGNDTLIRFDYENGTLRKNTTLRRQELEAEGNPDLRVLLGSKLCTLDYTSQYLRQCTVRIMEQTSDMIVFYIYASLNATPSQIEALCVLSVADIETPEDREENNNNNSTTPDHDNDYGSALTCTACHGSGDCSKCGGDGKIWSSASDKENRNCTKCNGSGRCQTCGGSGKRYN